MSTSVSSNLLECYRRLFRYYKELGDKAMAQIADEDFSLQATPESNSVAVIVRHVSGNMLSRFTDFLSSDGEKPWRNREAEFEEAPAGRDAVLEMWEKGWACFFEAVDPLTEDDLLKIVYIRNQGHTVVEALSRQLGHYSYHIGQITYVCRMLAGDRWASLSIPKGGSAAFNSDKFSKEKSRQFFADTTKDKA